MRHSAGKSLAKRQSLEDLFSWNGLNRQRIKRHVDVRAFELGLPSPFTIRHLPFVIRNLQI